MGVNQVYIGTTSYDNKYLNIVGVLGEGPRCMLYTAFREGVVGYCTSAQVPRTRTCF